MAGVVAGKTAIVTGAGRGIGRGIARLLAKEGARVVVCDIGASLQGEGNDSEPAQDTVSAINQAGGAAIASTQSITEPKNAEAIVKAALDAFGRVDILVNNAGILRIAPLENISEERWDETLAVHLKGTFNCTQAVLPFMKQQRKGKIINLAAPSALRGSYGVADYAAAKGGIIAFTRNAANELKAYNIQVNCISPTADTRMTETLTKFRREQLGISRREREFISPEAIAPAFLFFASSDSDYVSGQLLEVGRV
jgi:NAD(P)-dependent dehydrogenase (short-subunit alcohol dehydrogenase family)